MVYEADNLTASIITFSGHWTEQVRVNTYTTVVPTTPTDIKDLRSCLARAQSLYDTSASYTSRLCTVDMHDSRVHLLFICMVSFADLATCCYDSFKDFLWGTNYCLSLRPHSSIYLWLVFRLLEISPPILRHAPNLVQQIHSRDEYFNSDRLLSMISSSCSGSSHYSLIANYTSAMRINRKKFDSIPSLYWVSRKLLLST